MTKNCFIVVLVIILAGAGCTNSPNGLSEAPVGVGVAYRDGFRGDSIVLRCDNVVVDAGRGYSGENYAAAGSLFNVKAGDHRFGMDLPGSELRSETTFTALPAFRTLIEAYFDRGKKTLSYKISYLDTARVSLPRTPGPTLDSEMPR